VRKLRRARSTPTRPHIDQRHFAFETRDGPRFTAEIDEVYIR
jgi:hypothetical protein